MMQRYLPSTLLITFAMACCIYYSYYHLTQKPLQTTTEIPVSTSIPLEESIPPVVEEATETPAQDVPEQTPITHTIKLSNNITKKMIGYQKAFMTYTPEFSVEVNGEIVPFGQERLVEAPDNKLYITYHYNFLNGYRVGFRTVCVEFAPDTTHTALTFSWKNDNHVILTDALGYSVTAKSE